MSQLKRVKMLEIKLKPNNETVYIKVGKPCFTLYGEEATKHLENEKAAGRLSDPTCEAGFNIYRDRVQLC